MCVQPREKESWTQAKILLFRICFWCNKLFLIGFEAFVGFYNIIIAFYTYLLPFYICTIFFDRLRLGNWFDAPLSNFYWNTSVGRKIYLNVFGFSKTRVVRQWDKTNKTSFAKRFRHNPTEFDSFGAEAELWRIIVQHWAFIPILI